MIMSFKWEEKYNYGGKEYFSCPHLNCILCTYNHCIDEMDEPIFQFIGDTRKDREDANGEEEKYEEEEELEAEKEETTNIGDNTILDRDNFDENIISSDHPDIENKYSVVDEIIY